MRLVLLFLTISFIGCSHKKLTEPIHDICVYMSYNNIYCYPVNREGSKEYEREIRPGYDLVIDYESYTALKIHHNELHSTCK